MSSVLVDITYYTLETLPRELFEWAFNLVKRNLYDQ